MNLANLILENLQSIIGGIIVIRILLLAIEVVVVVILVRIICQYQAKVTADMFHYEYLAECIANELENRNMIPQKQNSDAEKPDDNHKEEEDAMS